MRPHLRSRARRRSPLLAVALSVAASSALIACSDQPSDTGLGNEVAPSAAEPSQGAAEDTAPGVASDPATETTPAPQTNSDESLQPTMDPANAAMLDQTIALVGGGELELAGLRDRPVLLWFWAPF